jgi:uncharacterized protein
MARAGFYAVESGKISFRHDGNWYSDNERIDNQRIALLFSRSIRRDKHGHYYLQVADERAPIAVEDTPFVVKKVDDDGHGGFVITTNDEASEPLDPSSLEIGDHDVLYCKVKSGAYRARFLRPAYYHLADHFMSDDGESFGIIVADHRYPIRIKTDVRNGAISHSA